MKKSKIGKLAALFAAGALLFNGFFMSCSSDDDGGNETETPSNGNNDDSGNTGDDTSDEDSSTTSLYRYGASSDADFSEGVLTAFDNDTQTLSFYGSSGGSASLKPYLMYYPTKLDQESGSYVFQAKVNASDLTGRVGIGLVGVKSSYVADGYAFLTASQKIRYGKSYSLDTGCTNNGQGFDSSTGLTDAKVTVDTDYIFRITVESGAVTFEILDSEGAATLASKASKFSTYFTTDDSVYFALGCISGSTSYASCSDIKATVDGTQYSIDTIENIPDMSSLTLSSTEAEVNKGATSTEITYTALDKSGNESEVTVESADTGIATVSAADKTITINGIASGSTTITVTNASNTALSETISVAVLAFNDTDPAYSGISFYPANGAAAAFEDGELKIAGFDSKPTIVIGGSVKIYDSDGNLADSISFEDETQTVWSGVTLNVKDQLVRATDNALYITPHIGALEYGKTYYVAISDGFVEGTIGGTTFEGLTNNASNTQWKFTVRSQPSVSTSITVNNDESATSQDFRTVQGALLAIGSNSGTYTVTIEPGTYYEDLYFAGSATVVLSGNSSKDYSTGDDGDVIISYTNANCINSAEKTRNVLSVISGNFVLQNLEIVNSFDRAVYGTADGQAEAVGFATGSKGTLAAYNCSFKSHQDTIRTSGKAWFYKCYIEGDTDFIWMEYDGIVLLAEECNIKSVYDKNAANPTAYITAPRMTTADSVGKGLVVYNSAVTVEENETSYLGRTPWESGYYSQAAFINTTLTGKGTINADWYNASISDNIEDKYVGWKIYNVTNNGTAVSSAANAAVITDTDFISDEYSGRETILNRMFSVSGTSFAKDSSKYWDVATLISDMGWTVTEDTSSSTLDDEEEDDSVTVTWDWTSNGVTQSSDGSSYSTSSITSGYIKGDNDDIVAIAEGGQFKVNSGYGHWNSGATMQIPVSEGSVVSVTVWDYTYAKNNFRLGGKALTDISDDETSDTASYTAEKAGYVTLKAVADSSYIKKISVNGLISTDDFSIDVVDFSSETAEIENGSDSLGLTAVAASTTSSDTSVVTVESVSDNVITIKSVSAGTAIITVGDGTNTATIFVTVGDYGAIQTTITKYTSSTSIDTSTKITFGSNGNYKTVANFDVSNVQISDNGGDNSQIKNGYISFDVLAGAVIAIESYSGYTSYTFSDGSTTSETQTGTTYSYTATSDCTIIITPVSSNNYFYSITVAYTE